MVNINNNFNVIPWYSALEQQNHRKWYAFDKHWPLIMPNTRFLPFQFVLEATPTNISAITVYSEDKSIIRDLGITPIAVPNAEKGYCVVMLHPEICDFTAALPDGRYYATLTIDDKTLYSEVFTVVDNISSYLKLTYWNTDTLYYKNGEINYANDFRYEMYLDTTIGKPEYEFSEELTTRLGYKFLESQISNKLYKFVFLGPEFICDAMRLIRLSDYIKLESGRDSYNAISFSYEPSWETQGDLASIEVSFETDTIIQKLPSFNRNQRENFYNALLSSASEPLLFDEGVVAQYYKAFSDAITGKLTRQLAEANVEEITEATMIPIDQGLGAAQRISLLALFERYGGAGNSGRYVNLDTAQEVGGIKTFIDKTIFKKDINVYGDAIVGGEVSGIVGEGTPAGVTDYSALTGKPSINGKELTSGENTLEALGIQPKGDYTTASQLDTTLADYAKKVYVSNNYASKSAVNTIQALIPATATATNQLADKDFVNSSIATATAEFRGSFTSLDELKATSGNLNDYAFYLHTDDVGNKVVDRYKWTTAGWLYEYTLNNSSFTAEQWAALNSAITATLVQSYNSHLNNSTIHITAAERNAWNNKWDYDEETIKAVKVNTAASADVIAETYANQSINFTRSDSKIRLISSYSGDALANGFPSQYVSGISAISTYCGWQMVTYGSSAIPNPYFRQVYDIGDYSSWKKLAFLSDNVASATKLKDDTAFTAWGQTFFENGKPKNVSGDLTEVDNITASGKATIQGDIISGGEVVAIVGEGTPAGVTDYSALTGKPSINGVTLVSGNNTLASLGIQAAGDYATISGVTTLLNDYATKTFISNNYVGKAAFNSHTADTDIHITAEERVAWNAKWNYDEATIKAVKVTSASSADSVAWSGITGKPSTFIPSAHTHTASEVSGLPTSLKNPYALTFGSKSYDGSAAATITASDLGALTSITKSMVEGVLKGDITSHTHSYLPLSGGTINSNSNIALTIKTNGYHSIINFINANENSVLIGYNGNYGAAIINGSNYLSVKNDGTPTYNGNTLLHSDNYNSYTPTLTGTGASGTWGISISGNAATATKLATPRTIWGQNFDGNGDILYTAIPTMTYVLFNKNTSTSIGYIGKGGSADHLYFGGYNGVPITLFSNDKKSSNNLTIATTGNILIGTTTDNGYKLDVNGIGHFSGNLIVDGEVSALVA